MIKTEGRGKAYASKFLKQPSALVQLLKVSRRTTPFIMRNMLRKTAAGTWRNDAGADLD